MQKGLFEPVIIQDQIPLSADRLTEIQAEALARVTHLEISTLESFLGHLEVHRMAPTHWEVMVHQTDHHLEHLGHLDQVETVVPHPDLVLWEAEVPAEMALPPEALDH